MLQDLLTVLGFVGCSAPANKTWTQEIINRLPTGGVIPSVQIPIQLCYGTMSVYRVCAGLAVFHLVMALIMIRTTSRTDFRSNLQHSWWLAKLVALVLLIVIFFLIPNVAFIGFGMMLSFLILDQFTS